MKPFVATFYSFKGGVGRTLLAANVAVLLARAGKTLLWDLDVEAPGLHRIPELTPERQPAAGFFEWLLKWQSDGVEPEDADYAALLKSVRPARAASNLFTLQAHGEKADFAALYQEVQWNAILEVKPDRGLALFRGALKAFGAAGFDYVLLDSRTGITDIGGLLTAILPHVTVLVGNYGAQNTGGLAQVWQALGRAAEGRIAVREPMPPLRRMLVASPIPQDQLELRATGREIWKDAFGEIPTQLVEVPFDSRLLMTEALMVLRTEESPVTQAYRAIASAVLAIEHELTEAIEAPRRHRDDGVRDALAGRDGSTRKGQTFEDRIAGLLALLGYAVEREQVVGSNQVDLVARSRVGLVDQLFLVECKDHRNEIHKKALEIFQTWVVQARRDHPTAQGMFIAQRFAPAARTYAKDQGLHLFTPGELEGRLFDFGPYLRRRCAEFEGSALFGRYVRQRVLQEGTSAPEDLHDHATAWSRGRGGRLWLLLGDYGTGKSSFVRQFAYELARAALEDAEQTAPVPVFVDLKEFPTAFSLDSLLLEHFRRYLTTDGFARFNPAAIRYLMGTGRVVLLLDAFDEMGLAQAGRSMEEQFREIAQHAREGATARSNRLLLTCRTHFFRSQQQVKDVAAGPDDPLIDLERADTALGQVARGFGATLGELMLFDDAQVAEFLRLHVGEERAQDVLRFVRETYDLPHLARRPVMLEMIMQSAERLAASEAPVTPGRLYTEYTGEWMRDRSSRQLQTTFAQRLALLETLARETWIAPENRLHYSELPALLRRNEPLFPGIDRERVDQELRTASFLVRDPEGYYRFSHKSFREYFYARHLVSALAAKAESAGAVEDAALIDALNVPPITPECAGFVADLLLLARSAPTTNDAGAKPSSDDDTQQCVRRLCECAQEVLASGYRPRVSENLVLLVQHLRAYAAKQARRIPELRAIVEGLAPAIPPGARLAGAELAGQPLSRISLRAADLSGARMSGALLDHADLREAVLRGADLSGVLLAEAVAFGADLSGATAAHASMMGIRLDDGNLSGACLLSADLTGAHLARARLDDADLRHSTLAEATADGASFDRADLTAASCVRASCEGATFRETRLRAARLKGCRLQGATWAPVDVDYLTAPRDPADWIGLEENALDPNLPEAVQRLPAAVRARLALGHKGSVLTVEWSPDGQRLASGSGDNTVKLWDAGSGACLQTLEGHGKPVSSVAWSPDGQRLASGSGDNTVKLWDAGSGACLQTLEGHGDSVWSVAWSPDGQRLASGSGDNTVKLWDAGSGACLQTLEGHGNRVWSVAWSPDGQRLASGSWDNTVKLWDAGSGACLQTLEGHGSSVWSVAWSPDGQRLASGSEDNTVKLWDAGSGACLQTLEGHGSSVSSVAWSPDGQRLASGSWDNTVKLWDAGSGACLQTLEGHGDSVLSVAWSPDGQRLASGSGDNTVKLWDAGSGACLQTLEGHGSSVSSVAWSPDGQRLASGSGDNTVKLWDAGSGACLQTLEGHGDSVLSVAWSPDGQRLASGSGDNTVKLWDAGSGACLQTLEGHGNRVWSVAWSPDGQRLASGSGDNTVKLWDAGSGACLQTLEGHGSRVLSVAWSPDGQRRASGSGDQSVKLWDAGSGACLQTLEGHGDSVLSVAWSPDGQRLASGSGDNTVKLWDAGSGACLQTLEGHGNRVLSVAWSPDGQRLASGSGDNTVKLWDAGSGACLQTLEGHGSSVWSVAWSPDGQRLASGSWDNTVKLWDAASGGELATLATTPLGWLTIYRDQRFRASRAADTYLRYVDAEEAKRIPTRIWHAEDVAFRMRVPDDEEVSKILMPNPPRPAARKSRARRGPRSRKR